PSGLELKIVGQVADLRLEWRQRTRAVAARGKNRNGREYDSSDSAWNSMRPHAFQTPDTQG
ncbi:MAG TPA: hypothetical protein VKP10_04240, partial [Gemmatimonadales bacterium]|nr:hypothetical protein [Gemmatimonadales bacterium]